MTKFFYLLFVTMNLIAIDTISAQNIGIGTSTPHSSARLDISSVNSGFLPPRLSGLQRNAIVNPVAGLIVYCTDCGERGEMQYYDGIVWRSMNSSYALSKGITNHTCGAPNVHNPSIPYGVISDYEGNLYKTVQIGTQIWMAENLRVTTYSTGSPIPQIGTTEWESTTTGAFRSINDDATNDCPYGKLYNWYAVSGMGGGTSKLNLCPSGWRVPYYQDWMILNTFLGSGISGGKMKSTGTQYWLTPNTDATNMSGFSGLPGGGYGEVNETGIYAIWWTSDLDLGDDQKAFAWILAYDDGNVNSSVFNKNNAYPVRCIKD